ncbi:hypothetical protein JW835_11895 [bacterium]|nr:hypothetical protein [bacterium]
MIQIEKEESLPARIGWIEAEGIQISKSESAYEELEKCAAAFRENYPDASAGTIEGTTYARQLFHAMGIDPTKRRPSSEALLKRALKNYSLPSVNTLVDVGNWCSMDFLLPICVYDADKLRGAVCIRRGLTKDRYEALNGSFLNLEKRYCLTDDEGAFGSPMTDSRRTAVSVTTIHAIFIIFAPADYPELKLQGHLENLMQRIQKFCGGYVVGNGMI